MPARTIEAAWIAAFAVAFAFVVAAMLGAFL